MMKNESNDLSTKVNNGLFGKIKSFISKLFKKEEIHQVEEEQEPYNQNTEFKDNIKIVDEFEEERIIKNQLDNNAITIEDLSSEQIKKMIAFYEQEIKFKENTLEAIKQRIASAKNS